MGAVAAQWAMAAIAAASAVSANVQANRASHSKPKATIKEPSSPIMEKKEEESIDLGSDRAAKRTKRSRGKRQLMAPQESSTNTGLQI